jgi:hypothetical protein
MFQEYADGNIASYFPVFAINASSSVEDPE